MFAFNCKSVFEIESATKEYEEAAKSQGSDRRAGKERVFRQGKRMQSPYGGNNGADKDGDPVARD
ncbi:MAG: hypothetical protein ACLRSW_05095 [Christensenellaceae bacterium]